MSVEDSDAHCDASCDGESVGEGDPESDKDVIPEVDGCSVVVM